MIRERTTEVRSKDSVLRILARLLNNSRQEKSLTVKSLFSHLQNGTILPSQVAD